jgi:hypothetical protein
MDVNNSKLILTSLFSHSLIYYFTILLPLIGSITVPASPICAPEDFNDPEMP